MLDPANEIGIAAERDAPRLNFNLAASNVVNTSAKTVTVMPMMAASAQPIDAKMVLIRGPIGAVHSGASSANTSGNSCTPAASCL